MRQPEGLLPDSRGKVRDLFDLGDRLLLVATDRLSAFDVVLPDPIPFKGEVLTRLSLFWFSKLAGMVPTHFLSSDPADLPERFQPYRDWLDGRSMLVRKAEVFPVECIVRGYLAGSGWAEYKRSGSVCGIRLPEGLLESSRLPVPLFTPSSKATEGHDVNISPEEMLDILRRRHGPRQGGSFGSELMEKSLAVYSAASDHAASRGIVIADTKFEFGLIDGRVHLVDEVLTPDSSRFWPADSYGPGRAQPSFDKQYVRDWLESSGWDKRPPAPNLPADVIEGTSRRYIQAYELITGEKFEPARSDQ